MTTTTSNTAAAMVGAKVETYKLYGQNKASGRTWYIRQATKVVLADGREISFIDKISKRDALRNAEYQLERGWHAA